MIYETKEKIIAGATAIRVLEQKIESERELLRENFKKFLENCFSSGNYYFTSGEIKMLRSIHKTDRKIFDEFYYPFDRKYKVKGEGGSPGGTVGNSKLYTIFSFFAKMGKRVDRVEQNSPVVSMMNFIMETEDIESATISFEAESGSFYLTTSVGGIEQKICFRAFKFINRIMTFIEFELR